MFACAFCPFCSFTIFHPSCCHHLLSSPLPPSVNSQCFQKPSGLYFFFYSSCTRGLQSYCMSSFYIPLSQSLCSLLPRDGSGWEQSDRIATPTSLMVRVAGLWWCFTSVWCLCVCVRACFVAVFVCSFTSYHRAIWDAEEHSLHVSASVFFNLPQGESICHDGGRCCCCFRAHSITERSH